MIVYKVWSNERIRKELDDCEQSADVDGLIFEMRDEYEKEIERLTGANDELKASLNWFIGENDRISKSWSREWNQYIIDKQKLTDENNRLRDEIKRLNSVIT